jgi:DNA-binding transcriptional ArsR family regulator
MLTGSLWTAYLLQMQCSACPSDDSLSDAGADLVFRVIAEPVRRLLIDRLQLRDGQTLRELCEGVPMRRQSVTQHLALLERAGVLHIMRQGREKRHYLQAARVYAVCGPWLARFAPRPELGPQIATD